MASIPCAAYQASHIHGNIRKQTQCRSRRVSGESNSSASPPSSPLQRKRYTNDAAMVIRISSLWPKHEVDNWQPSMYSPESAKSFTETFVNNVMAPLRKSPWAWNISNASQPSTTPVPEENNRSKGSD